MDMVKKPILHSPKINKSTIEHLPSEIKGFFTPDNWYYWVGALVVVLLLALLFFLIIRRRKRQKEPIPAAPPPPEPKKEEIPSSILLDVWKTFLKGVPGRFRPAVRLYDPYVVMGEAGSGKSQLIDQHTDWEGQTLQFHPSHTENPLLQIYLGRGVVVQELSSSLLNDASDPARHALTSLWKRTFKNRTPRVVLVIDMASLNTGSSDLLKRQANSIRGKLNVLSQCSPKPIEVCIALTHMDQIEGFSAFQTFLRGNGIPLDIHFFPSAETGDKKEVEETVSLSPKMGVRTHLENLETCLEPYETLLSRALITQPAEDFLQIIAFMQRAPKLFARLSSFVDILKNPDALSASPEIVQLFPAGKTEGNDMGPGPFPSHFMKGRTRKQSPKVTHQITAGAILFLGLCYLISGFIYEHHLISETYEEIDKAIETPTLQDNLALQNLFLDFNNRLNVSPLAFLPEYFPDEAGNIQKTILDEIRSTVLLPLFDKLANTDEPNRHLTYLMALIYASANNRLGKMVMDDLPGWSRELGLPQELIRSYVTFSNTSWDGIIPLEKFLLKRKPINPEQYLQPWLVFFLEVSNAARKPYITDSQLVQLQQTAGNLLQVIAEVRDYNTLFGIQMVLAKEAPISGMPAMTPIAVQYPDLFRESVRYLLGLIQKNNIVYPSVENLSLGQFLDNLKVMTNMPATHKDDFKFNIPFKEFSLTVQDWVNLIFRSRIILFMKSYMAQNAIQSGSIFFPSGENLIPIVMNSGNDGTLFFTGKATLDGRFTAEGFDQYVKPVLMEMPDIIDKLPVRPRDVNEFSNFVYREVEAYAARYVSEYEQYYAQFGMQATSVPALKYVLNQIQQQSSQFQNFLLTLKENTVFKPEKNPYVETFLKGMQTFDFIARLMQDKKGKFPDLDKYKGIIRQLQQDMADTAQPSGKGKPSSALVECLSPLGRICLSIFLNEEGSYLNLVKKWISSMDIAGEWQKPFLQPVYLTYTLGITEVESAVNAIWNDLKSDYISSFINKFPFTKEAKTEVSPDWLKEALSPKGEFWQKAEGYLLPVCQKKEQGWTELPRSVDTFHLPDDMLSTLNQMEQLKKNMWDAKGKPIPIALFIKPTPLPPISRYGENTPVAVLSYLRTGKSSVFGFNQQPEWQPFTIQWWENQEASVGVSFLARSNSSDGYGTITGPISGWSFYRLLQKGTEPGQNLFRWEIADTSRPGDSTNVEFLFQNDPWALFTIEKIKTPSQRIKIKTLKIY